MDDAAVSPYGNRIADLLVMAKSIVDGAAKSLVDLRSIAKEVTDTFLRIADHFTSLL